MSTFEIGSPYTVTRKNEGSMVDGCVCWGGGGGGGERGRQNGEKGGGG